MGLLYGANAVVERKNAGFPLSAFPGWADYLGKIEYLSLRSSYAMELTEFEDTIEKGLNKVPKRFREILKSEGIQVLAREKVPRALQDQYRGRLLFGVFVGVPYTRRSMFNIQMEPTRIELYKNSFERAFNNPLDMEDQIVKTVIHEIGHYFGFTEKELRRRNL